MASHKNNEKGERQRAQRDLVENYDASAPVDYQIRAVAFFDILGWGQAVEASKDDAELRCVLLNSIWGLLARTKDYVETETAEVQSEDEFSQFSDSIIVSFPYRDYRDLARLLSHHTRFLRRGPFSSNRLPRLSRSEVHAAVLARTRDEKRHVEKYCLRPSHRRS